jgi:plastocyanin
MRDSSMCRGRVWRRAVMVAVVLVAGLGMATGLSAGPPQSAAVSEPPAGPRIEIKEHKYSPATLTVQVGTTVTWVNHDDDVHTVTSSAQAFTSRGIDTDETFTYTFTKPGTYAYFCSLHPLMTATIVVK